MFDRLVRHWVYGGVLAAVLLLAVTPILARGWDQALLAVWLALPVYMLHQYEEHDDDRFRCFVNTVIGGGRELLSRRAVFIINIPGVWGVNAMLFALAATVDIGWGLGALYLMLVNAIGHIGQAAAMRRYNPGVVTAALLFVPLGIWGIGAVDRAGGGAPAMHAIGIGIAVAIHAAILVHVGQGLRRQAG